MKKLIFIFVTIPILSLGQNSCEERLKKNLWKMPENINELLYKFSRYQDTSNCAKSSYNINMKWNDSLVYSGKMGMDNLIKSTKYLKAVNKDQIALKDFLLSVAKIQQIDLLKEQLDFEALNVVPEELRVDKNKLNEVNRNSLEYIDKAIKAKNNIEIFYRTKLSIINTFLYEDFSLANSSEISNKKKFKPIIKSLKDALNVFDNKKLQKLESLILNFDDSINSNSFSLKNILDFPYNIAWRWLLTDGEVKLTKNQISKTLSKVYCVTEDYKNAAKYARSFGVDDYDGIYYPNFSEAYIYYKSGDYNKSLNILDNVLGKMSSNNPFAFGEEILKKYISGKEIYSDIQDLKEKKSIKDDWEFSYLERMFYYGYNVPKADTLDMWREHYNKTGENDESLIVEHTWSLVTIYSCFYKSLCYEKLGDKIKSKYYFDLYESMISDAMLYNFRNSDYQVELLPLIESQRIIEESGSKSIIEKLYN